MSETRVAECIIMDDRVFYGAMLVCITMIASAQILSYSAQRGMGDIMVRQMSTTLSDGHNNTFTVYRPYYPSIEAATPVVVTIPDPGESAADLYAFNIELSRRNMTVVSIDMSNHASMELSSQFLNEPAMRCLNALDVVRNEFDVNQDTFGILTSGESIRIAFELLNYSVVPDAFVVLDGANGITNENEGLIPGNFMLVQSTDSEETIDEAKEIMSEVSGVEQFQAGQLYGNPDNQTAYELLTTDVSTRAMRLDMTVVAEVCTWMIMGLQGTSQLPKTLNVYYQVYGNRLYAEWTTSLASGGLLFVVVLMVFMRYHRRRVVPTNPQNDGN